MMRPNRLHQYRRWLPLAWVGLSAVLLMFEFVSGPSIRLVVALIIPVSLAAYFNGFRWGASLAIATPLVHFGFRFFHPPVFGIADALINMGIRIAVFVLFAFLVDRVTQQARQISVLRNLLPICSFCKRIRTEDGRWEQLELYISSRSDARFSHTFCPDCGKKHYGGYSAGT